MAIQTLADYQPILKEFYSEFSPENLTYKSRPLFALLPKIVSFEGLESKVPVAFSNPQGVSASLAAATSSVTPTAYRAFSVPRVSKYGIATIDSQAWMASRSNVGAFLNDMTSQIDNAFLSVTDEIQIDLYGDGSGLRATLASVAGVSPNYTFGLTLPTDIRKIEVGMSLDISDPSLVSRGTFVVTALNANTGQFSVTQTVIVTAPVVADGVYRLGSKSTVGSTVNLGGVSGWLPFSVSPTDNWYGVNRSVDSRLSGVYLNAIGAPIDQTIAQLVAKINVQGGRPDYIFCHNFTFQQLVNSLSNRILYTNIVLEDVANVSFRAVQLQTDFGEVSVIADSCCPIDRLFAFQMNTWVLASLDSLPHIVQDDSLWLTRDATDSVSCRVRAYVNLWNTAPCFNGVAQIA